MNVGSGPLAVLRPRVCFCKSELCNGHDFKELKKPQELEKCNSSPLSLDQTSKYYYQSLTILLYNIICNLLTQIFSLTTYCITVLAIVGSVLPTTFTIV